MNLKALQSRVQWPFRSVTKCLLLGLLLALLGHSASAQTAVVLSPVPQLQFFTQDGTPLAFGCVFTYEVNSTTPLGTYTDYTGVTLNSNPVILSAGGSANIWLLAGEAYTFRVMSAGGTNCSQGTTLYTVNGIGGGSTTLTTVVPYSPTPVFIVSAQNQLFEITLTGNASAQPLSFVGITPPSIIFFQITQDGSGGHTFSWPANSIGGCTIGSAANQVTTQEFMYDGMNATAVGPCVIGNGPAINAGQITASGQIISTVTGVPPLVVASNDEVLNFNSNFLEGFDWGSPGTIGSVAPNTGVFTTLQANTSFILNGSTAQTGVQGSDVLLQSAGTVADSSPQVCTDANGGVTTTCTGLGPTFTPVRVTSTSSGQPTFPVALTSTQATVLTITMTFPSAPGTYRADIRYGIFGLIGPNVMAAMVYDTTNSVPFALSEQNANGDGYVALNGSEISYVTYAAGATVTFKLVAVCNDAAGSPPFEVTATSGLLTFTPNPVSNFSVAPVLSN
jgi:hypothetical protein